MTAYFIRNRIAAFMVLLALVTAGLVSSSRLSLSLVPSGECAAISVLIEYPGTDPGRVESVITGPAERAVRTVGGIKHIESSSEEGKCRINIIFSDDVNVRMGAVKVREKIGLISGAFPEEVQDPVVFRYDPSDRPVFIAALNMDGMNTEGMRDFAEKRIKPSIQRIEGVSEVNAAGGMTGEIHVEARRNALQARGLSLNHVASAVRSGNIQIPAGSMDSGQGRISVETPVKYSSLREIEMAPVMTEKGLSVMTGDLVRVSEGYREPEDLSRYNGEDLVTLYIRKGAGSNIISICREAEEVLASFPGLDFRTVYSQGKRIEEALENAALSCVWGMFIVFLILGVFYRKSEKVFPIALSIPACMAIVPVFLFLAGRGLNVMSLSGFALASGMVVDNGIVVIDSMKEGGLPDAGVRGAVISSTATTIAVFGPLLFLSKKAGQAYGDMAFTVTCSLLVSLFMSIFLIPAFHVSVRNLSTEIWKKPAVLQFIYPMTKTIRELEFFMFRGYVKLLQISFRKRGAVLSGLFISFFISLLVFSMLKNDISSLKGKREFHLCLEFPSGTALARADRAVKDVEGALKRNSSVKSISSRVEKLRGILTIGIDGSEGESVRKDIEAEADNLVKSSGAFAYVSGADRLSDREITVNFFGNSTAVLRKLTGTAASAIGAVPGMERCLLRYREGRPEYRIEIDREKAAVAGTDAQTLADTMRNSLFGPVVTKFIRKGREIDVRLRLEEKDRDSAGDLMLCRVPSFSGAYVPAGEIAELKEASGETRLYRQSGRRSLSISAVPGTLSFQEALGEIKNILKRMKLPEGYSYSFDRSVEEIKEERRSLALSLAVSIILVYMILAALFESVRAPLLIMISMPMALTGTAPVLWISSTPLTPPVYLGLVVLAGIVVNNGIILVNSIKAMDDRGLFAGQDSVMLISDASASRFRPVMITAATTVFGMVPLLLTGGDGSSLWRPFALTVCSGLLFSTVLTLLCLPLMSLSVYGRRVEGAEIKQNEKEVFR